MTPSELPPDATRETPDSIGGSMEPAAGFDCFVVMPIGKTSEEKRWYSGWYDAVIEDAVRRAGLRPVHSGLIDSSNAINDEIRIHLATAPMVVVDLGGLSAADPPNPNVMYELGIRHAMNLPHVILAWQGQVIPFDIHNQRILLSRRELADVKPTREKLETLLREAVKGHYYRPMDAVQRVASLEAAKEKYSENEILQDLIAEVRDLRSRRVPTVKIAPPIKLYRVADIIKFKIDQSRARKWFNQFGGIGNLWSPLMHTVVSERCLLEIATWSEGEYKAFFEHLGYIAAAKNFVPSGLEQAIEEYIGQLAKLPNSPKPARRASR